MNSSAERKPFFKRTEGRTVFETLLVTLLIAFFLFMAIEKYSTSVKPLRETALRIELSALRDAVTHFALINNRLPLSLKELVSKDIIVAGSDIEGTDYQIKIVGKYMEAATLDKEGNPLDPFGNRYEYDPETGKVTPTTGGYETW